MIVPIFQMKNQKLFKALTHSRGDLQLGLDPAVWLTLHTRDPKQEAIGPMEP